jgi:hypothetical protein
MVEWGELGVKPVVARSPQLVGEAVVETNANTSQVSWTTPCGVV